MHKVFLAAILAYYYGCSNRDCLAMMTEGATTLLSVREWGCANCFYYGGDYNTTL